MNDKNMSYTILFQKYNIICNNTTVFWVVNGEMHRDDGPAWSCSDGSEHWVSNGVLHNMAIRPYGNKKINVIRN